VSVTSIVRTHKGLFWAGDVGFYWTDGFQVLKISDNINETYRRFVRTVATGKNITGTYDASNERIYWAVNDDSTTDNATSTIVLDLKWGITERCCFTTNSNRENYRPAGMVFNDALYRGDSRGFLFLEDETILTDPKVDLTRNTDEWDVSAIIYDYRSTFYDFGSKFMRKYVTRILTSADNATDVSLQIRSSNDRGKVTGDLTPIRYKSAVVWGAILPFWGDPNAVWNQRGLIEEWRRFPAGGLRCQYKQIQYTNAEVEILTSDVFGQVSVNSSSNTAALMGASTWIPDMEDYIISFSNDNFEQQFIITNRDNDKELTFDDPTGVSPANGAYDFRVRGIPKDEKFELYGYVIHWMYISKSHTPFVSGSLASGS